MPEELDLDSAVPAGAAAKPPEDFVNRLYDPARDREKVRGRIAVGLTALFGILVLVLLGATIGGSLTLDDLAKLAGVLLSPVSGLLGAVTGFYYGAQSNLRS